MKRMILILVILMALCLFAESRSPIDIGSLKGEMLFRGLDDSGMNNSSNSTSHNSSIPSGEWNETINLSRSAGGEGQALLDEILNASNKSDEMKTYANLSQWGSAPKAIPPPPDSRSAKSNEIIRINHLGY